jgi:hypothetical protein
LGCGYRRVSPGIVRLAGLLDEHGDAVEADLTRYYQTDLRDLWRGDLTYRRLAVLIAGLPQESLTKTALRNATPVVDLSEQAATNDYGPWSQVEMLLAELVDTMHWLQWAKTKDGSDNKNPPKPFPRPGVDRSPVVMQDGKPVMNAKIYDMLQYVRENQGAAPV